MWKEEALNDLSSKDKKGLQERAIVNQTKIGAVSKATLGKLLRDGVQRMLDFPSA